MDSLGNILEDKKLIVKPKTQRRGNPMYGLACSLQEKLEIPISLCFKLLKQYDIQQLEKLVSWWKDYPFKKKNNIGLLYWKIKDLGLIKKGGELKNAANY